MIVKISMLNFFCPNLLNRPGTRAIRAILLLLLLSVSPVQAVVVQGLFEVTLPVPDESQTVRNAALADGLAEVLVRVSGDSAILQKLNPPNAQAYVKQFRYLSAESTAAVAADGAPPDKQLWVQYNPTRIMDLLRSNGIPIWSDHRREVVVWLAVRDGINQYVLRDGDQSPLKDKLEASMARRGIPVKWPRYDQEDQKQLRFADIWAGFREPLLAASRRYSHGPVITGSMSWNGREWISDWTLLTERNFRWALRGPSHEPVIAQAIDQVADEMGRLFAIVETMDGSAIETVELDIDQIYSIEKFVQVQDYLESLPAVQQVWLSRVRPGHVMFNVALRSKVDDFLRYVETGAVLDPVYDENLESPQGLDKKLYRFSLN